MGALKGSISYTLYHVQGVPEDAGHEALLDKIREFAFRELTPDSEDDMSAGWCSIENLLEVHFEYANVFSPPYVKLGLRIDRWSLPNALLKATIQQRTDRMLAEKNKTRLFKSEKESIRADVVRQMKQMLLPSATSIDMVWNLDAGTVRFWTHAARSNELFQELFESTFGVKITPTNPWTAAMECGLDEERIAELADIQPAEFVVVR